VDKLWKVYYTKVHINPRRKKIMSDLQTAYYIVGIVFMGLMLLIGVIAVIALLVIRVKINAIHQRIEDRLGQVADWAEKGTAVLGAIKKVTGKPKK
jgi:hypothetical protein